MANKRELLLPGSYYHLYNRANADDLLFTEEIEYQLFLKQYFRYSRLLFKTHCYCLLSNHFHFLVQVDQEYILNNRIGRFMDERSRSNYMSQHLGNFFNWYATYFNRKHSRKGSLFIHSFHRKPVREQSYLNSLTCYIHSNPVEAGLCNMPDAWKYSSYQEYTGLPGLLTDQEKSETIGWFEDLDNFIYTHDQYLGLKD